jgi:hypothetical protein
MVGHEKRPKWYGNGTEMERRGTALGGIIPTNRTYWPQKGFRRRIFMRDKRKLPKVWITLLLICSMGIGTTALGDDTLPEEANGTVTDSSEQNKDNITETQALEGQQALSEKQSESTTPAAETQADTTAETPGETAEEQEEQKETQESETQALEPTSETVQNQEQQSEENVQKQTDEKKNEAGETAATAQTEEAFEKGYAYTNQKVSVYKEKTQTEKALLGTLEKDSVVYALERFGDGTDENEWLRVLIAVEPENSEEQPTVIEGYLQAKELRAVKESEEEFLSQLSENVKTAVYSQTTPAITVPVSDFQAAVSEETLSETKANEETEYSKPETETANQESENLQFYQIQVEWEGDIIEIGDQITLTALKAEDAQVEWQVSKEDGVWQSAAQGQTYTFELTVENFPYYYRAVRIDPAE